MRRFTAVVVIATLSACSSTVRTVPPPPAQLAAQPGAWAVLTRPETSQKSRLPTPLSPGAAAAKGAKAGAAAAFAPAGVVAVAAAGSSGEDAAVGMLLAIPLAVAGIAIAPFTAIVGAGVGAGAAHSKAEIAAAETSMAAALDAANPSEMARQRIVALAVERAGRQIYDCGESQTPAACVERSAEPLSMLLTVVVSQPYIEVQGSIQLNLRLLLYANAAVLQVSDGATVYWRSWIYRGRQHNYFDLAAEDAKLFRAELEAATEVLATKIVDDLLIGGREEVHRTPEQPEGTVWTVIPP